MKAKYLTFIPVAVAIGASAAITFSGCGNNWLDTKDRSKTPSALMFDGQKAYDQEDYDRAAELFSEAVAKDPANVSARIGWSFALNGQAGLSLTEIMQNIIKQKSAATTKTSLADTGLASFVEIVGLKTDEKAPIQAAATAQGIEVYGLLTTEIRRASNKLSKLNESWLAICPVLPESVISKLTTDSGMNTAFSADRCKGVTRSTNNAALFSAAIGTFGQAASLYQLLYIKQFQANAAATPTTPDIVVDLEAKFTAIQSATNLATINDALSAINSGVSSELIPWTLANFEVLQYLVGAIDGMPQSVKDQINSSATQLQAARSKITEYKSAAGASADKMKTSLTQAAAKIDTVYASASTTDQQKICANFDALKAASGVTGVSKPASCPASLTGQNLNITANTGNQLARNTQKMNLTTAENTKISPEKFNNTNVDTVYLSLIEFFQLAENSRH